MPLLIIGSGLAGYTLAREFRKLDLETPVTIITADAGDFYSKPLLSNALAKGKTAPALATADAEKMAHDLGATILTHTNAISIDSAAKSVLANGKSISFGQLVFAVGAQPLRPPLQGDAVDEVLSVNNLGDYARFRAAIDGKASIAIIGAGLIGCEFANDLAGAGYQVTVIGPAPTPLDKLLPAAGGALLQQALTELGVTWCLGSVAERVSHDDGKVTIELSTHDLVTAEVVLSAIGLHPNTELAQAAGLQIARGIVVDRYLRTSAADIYAIGDCMEVEELVLPFVMPIMHAARTLAKTLAGNPTRLSYPAMPVVVKTPAHPIVVAPPKRGAQGEWQVLAKEDGVRACFYDEHQRLLGFALTGSAIAEKQALTQALPPVLA